MYLSKKFLFAMTFVASFSFAAFANESFADYDSTLVVNIDEAVTETIARTEPVDSAGNVIANFSFEEGDKGWNVWGPGTKISEEGARSGNAGLTVRNDDAAWNGGEQVIALPEGASNVTVSGWLKTENVVRGKETWENARISIEFRDDRGRLVGGYPPVVGQAEGTTEWTHYSNSYRASSAAQKVVVQLALGNATGTAHFDDITLTIRDRRGNILEKGRLSGIMDEGEWYVMNAGTAVSGGHYVDWSHLLDAPAGKHGFLQVKDGRFVFENGTPVRFWGTNLVARDNFAADSVIDSLVSRLAKMGVNMLRLHHLDAPWTTPNIFGNTEETTGTRAFSEESMRQLDYLIAKCKERGIYIFLDLLVHRDFTEADGIENRPPDLGGKQIGFFSEKIIELQKEFNENLLNRVNQFTGIAYKDEPAIALSAFINESTIFGAFSGDILTPPYRRELEEIWRNWQDGDSQLSERQLATFGLDWQNDRPRLKLIYEENEVPMSIRFLSELETKYFKDMELHARKLGVRIPLAGSNMPLPLLAMLRNNATLDFIASNEYWDHPQVWKIDGDWDNILSAPFHNRSQLRDPRASLIQNKSYFRLYDKPFIITEWNHCYPNEHVLEGVPLMAAYAALQDWDGVLQFDIDHKLVGRDRIRNYSLSVQPEDVAQWVMAAPLFLRGDVSAAPGMIIEGINAEQYGNIPNYSDFLERNFHLPFITRVAKRFDGESEGSADDYKKYLSRDGTIKSETGELTLNSETGFLKIETPRLQGISGFIGGKDFNFPLFRGRINNRHASIFAVSADGKDLVESKHFYLVVTGPAKMAGQVYDPVRNLLENAGEGDVLTQVIDGHIVIKKMGGRKPKPQVFALDQNGQRANRGRPLPLRKVRGSLGSLDLSTGRTLVYEVITR